MANRTGKVRSNVVRSFAFLFASLLVVGLLAASTAKSNTAFAQSDRLWYVGEGAQADTYMKYRVEYIDSNNGRPFEMILYFQERDENNNWIVPVTVLDRGQVITGTFVLSDLDLTVLGGSSDVPPALATYRQAYANSLQWLAAFVPKPGKDLDAASWGRIGSIGGSPLNPSGGEEITVAGETVQTTKVVYHKSVDNIIWVENEFPLPLKALTYVDVTTGTPRVQFAFELLERGTGQPEELTEGGAVPTPPLRQTTVRGTYIVELDWTPEMIDITDGQDVTFGINFYDGASFPIDRVGYNLIIEDDSGNVIQEFPGQMAADGTAQHQVTFNDTGRMSVQVEITDVNSVLPTGGFVEEVEFNIVVVPEFPISLAIVMAGIIGGVIAVTRFKGLPRFGNL